MPNCRNCGARLSKFDKDICPVCGTKDPLQGVSSETVEITSQIDLSGFKEGQKIVRRRKTLLILFIACGFTGAQFFYLKKKKFAILWLVINLLVMGGLFFLLSMMNGIPLAVAIIVPIVLAYLVNSVMGLIYHFLPDLKDGEGEFVV